MWNLATIVAWLPRHHLFKCRMNLQWATIISFCKQLLLIAPLSLSEVLPRICDGRFSIFQAHMKTVQQKRNWEVSFPHRFRHSGFLPGTSCSEITSALMVFGRDQTSCGMTPKNNVRQYKFDTELGEATLSWLHCQSYQVTSQAILCTWCSESDYLWIRCKVTSSCGKKFLLSIIATRPLADCVASRSWLMTVILETAVKLDVFRFLTHLFSKFEQVAVTKSRSLDESVMPA